MENQQICKAAQKLCVKKNSLQIFGFFRAKPDLTLTLFPKNAKF